MIIDTLDHADTYLPLHPLFAEAFAFLKRPDLASLPDGKIVLVPPDRLFAAISSYTTKPVEEGKMEAHRTYIDIQFLCAGEERLGWAPLNGQPEAAPFSTQNDIGFYEGDTTLLPLAPPTFIILFPQDGHLPGRIATAPQPVKKIVLKVKL